MATSPGQGALHGVVIVDLTQHLSGPFATQMLADLGARVIKVEPPTGDPTRRISPHFVDGDSAYYMSVNRNKESVCIDLKSDAGRGALYDLISHADAVMENFRPGTLDRLGIGFDEMQAWKPSLVLCSISGFGQDGPYRDRPAFDMVVQALSGGMSLTGEIGGRPVRSGLPIGDLAAGSNAATAVLAGLLRAAKTGAGSRIDISMLDTQISLLSYVAAYHLMSGVVPGPQGRQHMSIPTYRALTCGDGRDVVITANVPRMWDGLCKALQIEHLVDDPRYSGNAERLANRETLSEVLEAAALRYSAEELLQRLTAYGVPSAPINNIAEALADPQVAARDLIVESTRGGETYRAVGNPLIFEGDPSATTAPPRLGEHTHQVFADLCDYNETRLASLTEAGVIGPHVAAPRQLESASQRD
jgi:CoA:oxalate CoA-transferase